MATYRFSDGQHSARAMADWADDALAAVCTFNPEFRPNYVEMQYTRLGPWVPCTKYALARAYTLKGIPAPQGIPTPSHLSSLGVPRNV
jgi:hypothetical protein